MRKKSEFNKTDKGSMYFLIFTVLLVISTFAYVGIKEKNIRDCAYEKIKIEKIDSETARFICYEEY